VRRPMLVVLAAAAYVLAGCGSSTSPEAGPDVSAALEVTPTTGTAITDFTFDASASTVHRRGLEFRWDWESDGVWDTDWSGDAVVERRFVDGDTLTVTVQADEDGARDAASAAIILDSRHGHALETLPVHTTAPWVLGTDGTHLWSSDWNTKRIYKIDPATGDTLLSHGPPNGWPNGIAYDGASFWVSDYRDGMMMFEMDPLTWTEISTFPIQYSSFPGGLAWDGGCLYHGSQIGDADPRSADGRIHKYATDGTEIAAFDSPRGLTQPCGLAYDGEHLWVSILDRDTLYVVDPEDGTVLRAVPTPFQNHGIAVLDDHVWAVYREFGYDIRKVVP
jgi:hypothetical protein